MVEGSTGRGLGGGKVSSLDSFAVPTLEAVEQRRLQLWSMALGLLLALSLGLAVLASIGGQTPFTILSTPLVGGLLGLATLFSVYAVQKEMELHNLEEALIGERVLAASLTGRLREVGALLEAARATNLSLELEEVLATVVRCAAELLGGRGGSIMLVHGGAELRTVAVWGESWARGAVVRFGEGVAGRAAAGREPLLVNGTLRQDLPPGSLPASAMSVPLLRNGALLGVLNVNADASRTYNPHDLRALSQFAEQAARAVSNAQLYEAQRLLASQKLYQALHDPLTGLANRSLFVDRVEHALRRRHEKRQLVAVLFIDLDDFRRINDSLGHAAGDSVLVAFTERLRSCLRSDDTMARFGSDEFAVLVENVTSPADATLTADRIVASLGTPVRVNGNSLWLQATIGIAIEDDELATADELLRGADLAMHEAKRAGGGRVAVFEPSMHTDAVERLRAEVDIRRAFAEHELAVHYQPIVDLRSGKPVAAEALVRWHHPERGLLPAALFLDAVGAAGLQRTLDRWVLDEACAAATDLGPAGKTLPIHVNLTPASLESGDVVEAVADVLERTGLLPQRLVIEITESSVLHHTSAVEEILAALKGLGARLAVDDFGTGYSSFAYLRKFPVDTIKIDRAFIEGLGRDPGATALVQAIVRLAHSLALEVVAEGVEQESQAAGLRQLGCSLGQGWLFSRALPLDELRRLLAGEGESSRDRKV